jgi:chemotaxis protein MotB
MVSCASTKELDSLKTNNNSLSQKLSDLQVQLDKTNMDIAECQKQSSTLKLENEGLAKDSEACEASLNKIKSSHDTYMSKLGKMKAELNAAFPNNLNDANFSIREEDGRLIIRIPNNILYKPGSADFDGSALLVIQKLSKVFENNKGLQIMIEGHTDITPIKSSSKFKDNWDLSFARAINVSKQLVLYGLEPQRLTAAGRAYYSPISRLDNDEARSLNRRTEIIIRPRVAELLKMIDDIE